MYLIAVEGKEEEGAYSVLDEDGEKALYLFEEEDDAERYAGLLEADDYPDLSVVEVDEELAINMCNMYNYRYVICLLYTSPSPRDKRQSRMPSSA